MPSGWAATDLDFDDVATRVWTHSPRRWPRPRAIAAAVVAIVAIGAISTVLAIRSWAATQIRDRALPLVADRIGRPVSAGAIEVGFGEVVLRDLVVAGRGDEPPLARFQRVTIGYEVGALFDRVVRITGVEARGVSARGGRDPDGNYDFADLLSRSPVSEDPARASPSSWDLELATTAVELRDARVTYSDARSGLTMTARLAAGAVYLDRDTRGARLELRDGEVVASADGTSAAALLARNQLAEVGGSITIGAGEVGFELTGAFADSSDQRWTAIGRAIRDRRVIEVTVSGDRIAVDRLGPVLDRAAIIEPESSTLTGDLRVSVTPAALSVRGTVAAAGLNVDHPYLAARPVRDIAATATVDASFDREARLLRLDEIRLESGDAAYQLSAEVQLTDARTDHLEPRLEARLRLPATSCQRVLESIPADLVPALQGFELTGDLAADVEIAIDWTDIEATRLDGSVGLDGCRVVRAPAAASAERLNGSFEHRVPVGDGWMTYTVGPENPDFVPLSSVSGHLIRSMLTTEDSRFFHHRGFITKEFRTALVKNLERGRFAYGASSITMQMVKNVLLGREKTASRKLQELFLTWYVEGVLSKQRILEIYVNAIEYGPGVYGIKPAARQYFAKHPRQLNPVESAFISSILPAPSRRYRQLCRGWAGQTTHKKIERILDHMFERNRLNPEQYIVALDTPLVFRGRRRAEMCREPTTENRDAATLRQTKTPKLGEVL